MIRILLVLLAILVAAIAFFLDQPWLYVAASVPLIGALGLLGWHLWDAYQRQQEPGPPSSPDAGREEEAEELGVMDVRPQDQDGQDDGSAPKKSPEPSASFESEAGSQEDVAAAVDAASQAEHHPALDPAQGPAETEPAVEAESHSVASVASEDRPVLAPFLESLRAVLGAQTVCLLVQEEVVLEYRVEALASVETDVQDAGTFETRSPLLTATMSRQPVTVRQLEGGDDRADLGFYDAPPAINQVAVAPVEQPDAPATVFVLADATAETDLATSKARSLLERFADTIGLLRGADEEDPPSFEDTPSGDGEDASTEPPKSEDESSDQPRPRREIIAEEMEAADAGNEDLALVLVHLNRAESIARRGEEAVATAEQLFRTRLEHFAPGQRVERFGELTYGLFPRRDVEAVEGWVADLQEVMDQETGELEGGVSVGVAVRNSRHDPEDLRADATRALQKAYETGTSTIVE
jgi:hypothetical protein